MVCLILGFSPAKSCFLVLPGEFRRISTREGEENNSGSERRHDQKLRTRNRGRREHIDTSLSYCGGQKEIDRFHATFFIDLSTRLIGRTVVELRTKHCEGEAPTVGSSEFSAVSMLQLDEVS